MALFPFTKPTNLDTVYLGGIATTKWIWSIWTSSANISTYFHAHNYRMMSLIQLPTSPSISRYRYLGHQTKWYLQCQIACAKLLKSLFAYLLRCLGSPTRILAWFRLGDIYLRTYPQSKAGTISLADSLLS